LAHKFKLLGNNKTKTKGVQIFLWRTKNALQYQQQWRVTVNQLGTNTNSEISNKMKQQFEKYTFTLL
jgi:hypothetical protein